MWLLGITPQGLEWPKMVLNDDEIQYISKQLDSSTLCWSNVLRLQGTLITGSNCNGATGYALFPDFSQY
jgi:hypothetical protein